MSCGHSVTSGFLFLFVVFAERIATNTLVLSICPSAYDNATTIGPILWNFAFGIFLQICFYFPILFKILQKWQTFYIYVYVPLCDRCS
jgi:hypothetical protein